MFATAWSLLLSGSLLLPQGEGTATERANELPPEPRLALAAMLDLTSPVARRAAADHLAARSDVTLAQWLAAIAAVPLCTDAPQQLDARTRLHRVPLWIMGREQPTELVVRVPIAPPSKPLPLLFVGHEAGGDARAAIATWAPLADRFGWLLAAYTEPCELYRPVGWAYEADARQAALGALRAVRRRYDVDERRVVVAGAGRGGHMAWDLALRAPDHFSGLIAIDGSPRLGNILRENNLRFVESLPPMAVRAIECGAPEPLQAANRRRALQLLRSFGAIDARLFAAPTPTAAFTAADGAWDAFFTAQRTMRATLVRLPELGEVPLPDDWGRRDWVDIVRVNPDMKVTWTLPPVATTGKLDEQGRRNKLDDEVRAHTPRLQIARTAPGRFTARSRDIDAIRLLLTQDQVAADGSVSIDWDGHPLRKLAAASATVLLREFAERCDRTFLPTIEVVFP